MDEKYQEVEYRGNSYIKPYQYSNKIKIDQDFYDHMERIKYYAKECEVILLITSSSRTKKEQEAMTGTVVPPSPTSCHLVGHAIDFNVYTGIYEKNLNKHYLFNSKILHPDSLYDKKCYNFSGCERVRKFIQYIKSDTMLRWGGKFQISDPVHIDDNLHHNTNTRKCYIQKYNNRFPETPWDESKKK